MQKYIITDYKFGDEHDSSAIVLALERSTSWRKVYGAGGTEKEDFSCRGKNACFSWIRGISTEIGAIEKIWTVGVQNRKKCITLTIVDGIEGIWGDREVHVRIYCANKVYITLAVHIDTSYHLFPLTAK